MRLQNITIGITEGLQKIAVRITFTLRWAYNEIIGRSIGICTVLPIILVLFTDIKRVKNYVWQLPLYLILNIYIKETEARILSHCCTFLPSVMEIYFNKIVSIVSL